MIRKRSLIRFVVVVGFILALLVSQVPVLRSDFVSFYTAATIARTEPERLYDQDLQFELQGRLGKTGYLPFAYPPLTALVFIPFSLLGFQQAYLTWLLVSLLVLLLSLHLLVGRAGLSPSQVDALLLFTLLFFPVYVALVQGQLSMVVLLLFTLFVTEERTPRAGLWAGLLLIKPQLALIPFLVLFLGRNWRGAAVGLATGMIQVVTSLALVGFAGLQRHLTVLRSMSTDHDVLIWVPRMHNLRQVSWFLGTHESGFFVLAAVTLLVFSVTWILNSRSKWTIVSLLLASCLVSPHLFLHDLTLLLLVGALLIGSRTEELGYKEQVIWAGSGLVALLGLSEYPIVSGVMIAGFVFAAVKSFTGPSLSRPRRSRRSGTPDVTEVLPAVYK